MKAVDKFEYRRGYKFSTMHVVDSPGDHAFDRRSGRTIRIPVHIDRNHQQAQPHLAPMIQEMGASRPPRNWR